MFVFFFYIFVSDGTGGGKSVYATVSKYFGEEKKTTRVELDFQPAAFQSKSVRHTHQTPERISGLGVPGVFFFTV